MEFYGGNSNVCFEFGYTEKGDYLYRKHQKELYSYFRYTTSADEIIFSDYKLLGMMKKAPSIQIVP